MAFKDREDYNVIENYVQLIEKSTGDSPFILLWVLALFYIGLCKKEKRDTMVIPYLVILIVVLNPITVSIILHFMGIGEASRVVWCLMSAFLIGYVLTDLTWSFSKGIKRTGVFIGFCLVLVFLGKWIYIPDNFSLPQNRYKISNDTIEVSNFLGEYYPGEKVIMDEDLLIEAHQYDASILLYYGRYHFSSYIENVIDTDVELAEYLEQACEDGVSLIILQKNTGWQEKLNSMGWVIRWSNANYDIYEYVGEYWTITNYADQSGNQGMFYTLQNKVTGEVIVVDGGWRENEEQVRSVINSLGGHVDAWFITHFDNDHVDAFNEIYAEPQGIVIEKIFITPLARDDYMAQLRDWDTPESYQRFMENTEGDNRVIALHRGDTFSLCRLGVEVFNSYDELVREYGSGDIPNDASLVFKLIGQKNSILFCGDCHDMMEPILQQYGIEIAADMVQLGHHGNNSFPIEFYDVVQPRIALFDAPGWLMEGEQYTAKNLKEHFLERNVEVYDLTSGSNEFIFE